RLFPKLIRIRLGIIEASWVLDGFIAIKYQIEFFE
ncbi:MAG: hypothetical protein ACI8RD_011231, partial [Bacillariaceae sp.]